MKSGLVSITFRSLTPEAIIVLVAQAGLDGIEWGADVHVKPDNEAYAAEIGRRTREAGLLPLAYGSYCRMGDDERGDFTRLLDTAATLGAPVVRVWAGQQGSAAADARAWDAVVQNARVLGDLAAARGLRIAFEYHGNTLTDTDESAQLLMTRIAHPSVGSMWQPPAGMTYRDCMFGLMHIAPWLVNLHVFSWQDRLQLPLATGERSWLHYLSIANAIPGEHNALIEFVKDGSPDQFLEDARTLKAWIARLP